MQHNEIWEAIDVIAKNQKMSTSKLAQKAGLDPTSFNKSKRVGASGKLRWPTTESLSLVLKVSNLSLIDFAKILNEK